MISHSDEFAIFVIYSSNNQAGASETFISLEY